MLTYSDPIAKELQAVADEVERIAGDGDLRDLSLSCAARVSAIHRRLLTTTGAKQFVSAAEYLCDFRIRHGLTWTRLAEICEVTTGAAQKWPRGQQPGGDAVLRAQQWERRQGEVTT